MILVALLISTLGSDSFPQRELAEWRSHRLGWAAVPQLAAAAADPDVDPEIRLRAARLLEPFQLPAPQVIQARSHAPGNPATDRPPGLFPPDPAP